MSKYNSEKYKEYYKKNKEKIAEYSRVYRSLNGDKIRERNFKYQKKRLLIDPNFKLIRAIRTRLRSAISNKQKTGSAVKDLGCSISEVKIHLEKQFKPGMTWENYGRNGWHIDHIIPLSKFNLSNREEFLKANHYTNLQPLWAEENYKKGNKVYY